VRKQEKENILMRTKECLIKLVMINPGWTLLSVNCDVCSFFLLTNIEIMMRQNRILKDGT
jgi:hypothetical protein